MCCSERRFELAAKEHATRFGLGEIDLSGGSAVNRQIEPFLYVQSPEWTQYSRYNVNMNSSSRTRYSTLPSPLSATILVNLKGEICIVVYYWVT